MLSMSPKVASDPAAEATGRQFYSRIAPKALPFEARRNFTLREFGPGTYAVMSALIRLCETKAGWSEGRSMSRLQSIASRRWLSLAGLLLAMTVGAANASAAGLIVEGAWARASLGGAKNGIVYATLRNAGGEALRLVGGSTPVADRIEFHIHVMDGDVMTMKELDSIPLQPGGTAVLKPGGMHVMLVGLKRPLKEGESFPLILTPANGAAVTVQVTVLGATANGPAP
jgi:periplasmic copper chaperone A